MKLAFLGLDSTALELVRAAASGGQHEIVQICEAEASHDIFSELAPQAIRLEHWETLLHDDHVEAVVVSSDTNEELRAEQLRKLALASIPILVIHPACDVNVCYELDMIRQDAKGILVPYFPGCNHPALRHLSRLSQADQELGTLEQVVIERAVENRSRIHVLRRFSQDVAILRTIVTDLSKVSAMGPSNQDETYTNLSVHLSGSTSVLARWSMVPMEERVGAKLTMFGSEGNAVLTMVGQENHWTLEINSSGRHSQEGFLDWDGPASILASLSKAIAEKKECLDWNQACRDAEFADVVPHSLRRGRAIELQEAIHSEEQTFKGIMAIGGCGLLLFSFFLLILFSTIEGLKIPWLSSSDSIQQSVNESQDPSSTSPRFLFQNQSWQRLLPALCLLAPMAVFLFLQLFKLVFHQPREGEEQKAQSKLD